MRKDIYKKIIVLNLVIILCFTSYTATANSEVDKKNTNENILEQTEENINQDVYQLTLYTYDKTGIKQQKFDLSYDKIIQISKMFEEFRYKIVIDPQNKDTQELKTNFINLLDENDLITKDYSKEDVFSLLNPNWLQLTNDNHKMNPFLDKFSSIISIPILKMLSAKYLEKNKILDNSNFGFTGFCSISSGGTGAVIPLFMLPRPRIFALWLGGLGSLTLAANLITGKGFAAAGAQGGIALGFMGIGLSYALPGATFYGFIGYALFVGATAEIMEFLPENLDPAIFNENPSNGQDDVTLSFSKLSFEISDPEGEIMSYKVTTEPNIGSGEGIGKDGEYSIQVQGLEADTVYKWTVEVSDRNNVVKKDFNFITEGREPFDPFDEGWQYRKKITIDHNKVQGTHDDFTVLINIVDSDLREKAQSDGDDILFMDGAGVANKLYHEIESFQDSTGDLIAWVRIPELYENSDTEFYMYYGNPGCNSQQFSEKTWDSSYCGIWHLDNFYDSTKNNNDGTNHGTDSYFGKIGYAKRFVNENHDYIDLGDMQKPADGYTAKATFEAWIKPETLTLSSIIDKCDNSMEPDRRSYFLYIDQFGSLKFTAGSGTWYPSEDIISSKTNTNDIITDTWQYVVATVDLSKKEISFYYNGELKESTLNILGSPPTHFYDIDLNECLGVLRPEGPFKYFDGVIDEVKISKAERNNDWILTSYNSMNDPSSFISIGPEE